MSRLIHLSDLHFGAADQHQEAIHLGLVAALEAWKGTVNALFITGDVFDSNQPAAGVLDGFASLLARFFHALGRPVPTVLLPGNHDRRDVGVFAPWTGGLFEQLAERLRDVREVQVLGNATPFLAQHIEVPGVDADVAVYDSSYLPRGLISAGGQIRQEDLIQLGSHLPRADRPLLFLLHHHLVPTPVTDTSVIATAGRPVWQRLLVSKLLPELVGHGDREELTMTALGAGSALTTLQTLGRAVVVLHGHKHYPTARLLKGLREEDGDLVLTSAGSCGKAQDWSTGDWDEAPRLWPSVNVVELTAHHLEVLSQAWSPSEPLRRNTPRPLVRATRQGLRWVLDDAPEPRPFEPVLALNETRITLATSGRFLDRYDLRVTRHVEATPSAYQPSYFDVVDGPPGARVVEVSCGGAARPDTSVPARLEVPLHGQASWTVLGGVAASIASASAVRGPGTCFSSVELHNRSRAALARLVVDLGPVAARAFASATDVTTGAERPWPLTVAERQATVEYTNCPARTLLRVYWPLR